MICTNVYTLTMASSWALHQSICLSCWLKALQQARGQIRRTLHQELVKSAHYVVKSIHLVVESVYLAVNLVYLVVKSVHFVVKSIHWVVKSIYYVINSVQLMVKSVHVTLFTRLGQTNTKLTCVHRHIDTYIHEKTDLCSLFSTF
jgi:hypothetical protein